MKVLLISTNTEQINFLPLALGLGCIAAATRRAGHDVRMIDLMCENDSYVVITDAIRDFSPDIIGMSVRNIDDQQEADMHFFLPPIRDVVEHCRTISDAPIVLGGAGYSIFPESSLAYLGADMGIQGEGEIAFSMLLERLEKGSDLSDVPGLYLPGRGLQGERVYSKDLDSLPLPDPRMWSFSNVRDRTFLIPVQTRRGCPLKCNYCSTGTIEGYPIRKRSPNAVVEWIAQWVRAGLKEFAFVDNTFNLPASYARELCRQIREADLDISWRCIVYPKDVDDELVTLMEQAGCKEVSLGFESGCEKIFTIMNKRFSLEDVQTGSKRFGDHGIHRIGFLLLGGPGETKETVEESLAFVDALRLEEIHITVGVRIYPFTPLAKTAVEDGMLSPDDDLLIPRFYLVKELREWLADTVDTWHKDINAILNS